MEPEEKQDLESELRQIAKQAQPESVSVNNFPDTQKVDVTGGMIGYLAKVL